jgi:hypothetical protein
VEIVDSLGCRISTIDLRKLGINDNLIQSPYTIFPNPASDYIRIENETASPFTARLINNLGQTIAEAQANLGAYTLNTERFPNGIYHLYIFDKTKLLFYKVVISK